MFNFNLPKSTNEHVRPEKSEISLHIRTEHDIYHVHNAKIAIAI